MLEFILFLLPRHYSENEIDFHRQRCLRKYRRIVDLYHASGFCDKSEVVLSWKQLSLYSLPILKMNDPKNYKILTEVNSSLMKSKMPNLVLRP
jgi:hypothetical protein